MSALLGINCAYHEDACALVVDGELVAAAEEERFSRVKHAKRADVEGPRSLPLRAIDYCLQAGDVQPSELDWIGYSFNHARRLLETAELTYPYEVDRESWGGPGGERRFFAANASVPRLLSDCYGVSLEERFVFLDHHLCHAASAFYPSGFADAAVLVIDGIGEATTAWLGRASAGQLVELEQIRFPASLGLFWERMAEFCGFDPYNASYLMGLAGYGGPTGFSAPVSELLPTDRDLFSARDDVLTLRVPEDDDPLAALERYLGVPRNTARSYGAPYTDIAWAAQAALEERMLILANRLHRLTGVDALCLAGGVALNCVANRRLLEDAPFDRMWVQPAANDAGTSLGAALLLAHTVGAGPAPRRARHAYWGPAYTDDELERALDRSGLSYQRSDDIAGEAAQWLADGRIVAWFQGRMEWGPRALGNRSLLADPRRAEIRTVLNRKVKHRESFRPFCPSVLREEAADWFAIPGEDCGASDYMLCACRVHDARRDRIPAVVHVDGTSRIQTVCERSNPLFASLLRRFRDLTDVPMVLNTSFNDSEPIVCSPADAIATFERSHIDHLALGPFSAWR